MLNQKGVVHLLVPVILLIGLIAGVYLITSGNPLKLFSKAANPPIVFKNTDGSALPVNSNNIPQTTSATVRIEFTSTLEAIATATPTPASTPSYVFCDANQDGTVNSTDGTFVKGCWNKPSTGECKKADLDNSGKVQVNDIQKFSSRCPQIFATSTPAAKPAKPATKGVKGVSIAAGSVGIGYTGAPALKYAENPTDLDTAAYIPYTSTPMIVDHTFTDLTPGQKFIWVEFKTPDGRTDRRSAQIELLASATPSPTPSATPSAVRVFFTSTKYNGNLGGTLGADAKCQERASAASLGGTWKTWLSDSNTSAASRLAHYALPYKLITGVTIANDWNDLTDGNLQHAIDVTEFGTDQLGYVDYSGVWTGTRSSGESESYNCGNWSSSTSLGTVGSYGTIVGYGTSLWTSGLSIHSCATTNHLYCFEEITGVPTVTPLPTPTPAPITAKRVFVTYAGNGNLGGLAGADAKCQQKADAAHLNTVFKAWLSDSSTSAGSRLFPYAGPYKLVNGVRIADNWNDLTDGSLQNPININENGQTIASINRVWTGTNTGGQKYSLNGTTSEYYCFDWTQNSGGAEIGNVSATDQNWTAAQGEFCGSTKYIYCLEQ